MWLDLAIVAAILTWGNIQFRRFEPDKPVWRRIGKACVILAIAAVISHYFGRAGVWIAVAIAALPVIYIHGIWLPRHGVNGWTGEPLEKYYALRGWKH
jgi:hypothetical protein